MKPRELLPTGFLVVLALAVAGVSALRKRSAPTSAGWSRHQWEQLASAPFSIFEAAVVTFEDKVLVFGGFYNEKIQATAAVWAFDTTSRAWTRRHDMPTIRTHANGTVLNEKIWFAGGFVGDSPGPVTAEVWRYDPRADQWAPGPPLPAARGGGALIALNGKLHYFGGYLADRQTGSEDHWVLEPAGSQPTEWTRAAPLPNPRGHFGAIALNGLIYALGGCIGHDPYPAEVAFAHRYDPATDRWAAVAPLPTPRSHFEPGIFVRNGRIVIVGGRSRPTGRESVDEVTEYDPVADRWMALSPLPELRHSPIAALVGNRILAGLGGRATSNPDNRTIWLERRKSPWRPAAPLPTALGEVAGGVIGNRLYLVGGGAPWTLGLDLGAGRWDDVTRHAARLGLGDHHAAEVWHGRLYLLGGLRGGQGAVQIYDPATESWRLGPFMPFHAGSSASALIGDQIYVAGGIIGGFTTRLAARFDPASETWSPIAPMPRARNHAAAATDGRRLFVFGGRGPGSGDANVVANGFADVQIYDPATNRWIASGAGPGAPAPVPQARGGMGKAVYFQGEFWLFGGETLDGPGAAAGNVYARVDIYDPVANRWRAGPPLPTPRHGIFPLLVGDRILVLGGGVRSGGSASVVAEILDLAGSAP